MELKPGEMGKARKKCEFQLPKWGVKQEAELAKVGNNLF